MSRLVSFSVVIGVTVVFLTYFTPTHHLPFPHILELARQHTHQSSDQLNPLQGRVAVVTGSTSGLGMEISAELYHLGATVILASRSLAKLEKTRSLIMSRYNSSLGKLHILELDTSDLESVQKFVRHVRLEFPSIHYLINNAGIHYTSQGDAMSDKDILLESKQGFDLAFATNYLGHFLLTESLRSLLIKSANDSKTPSKVIQISSTVHESSSGSMLLPSEDLEVMPSAAMPSGRDMTHRDRAYANNKLAQILHAQELHRHLEAANETSKIRVLSVCPG